MLFKRVPRFSRGRRLEPMTSEALGGMPRASPLQTAARMAITKYFLRHDVFLCVAKRYCVFLDVEHDRYLAIQRNAIDSLGAWLEGWGGTIARNRIEPRQPDNAANIASELSRLGILTDVPPDGKPVRPEMISAPINDAALGEYRPSSAAVLRQGVNLVFSTARARRTLETRSFQSTVRGVTVRRYRAAGHRHVDLHAEARLVAIFNVWRAYYIHPYLCLFDSLCLLEFLARHAFFPRWVFGVNAEPFQAHCWLQEGSMVLNDTVERVSAYTPIMSA